MKRYRRDREGNTYFFTLVTHNRRPILTTPENVERLREAFRRVRRKHPFSLAAIVVLPDHLHAIWELPLDDTDYSSRWAQIKRYFSVGAIGSAVSNDAARLKRREFAVWQRRFLEHRIRNDEDFERHADYIHYNPVKHGVVSNPWDRPFSSLERCAKLGWYASNWGLDPNDLKPNPDSVGE